MKENFAIERKSRKRKRIQKIPIERNILRVLDARQNYSREICQLPDERLIFLDETGFNLHTCEYFGYAPLNMTPTITVPANKGQNISILCAISVPGLICYKILDGVFNAVKFEDFLQELAEHLNGKVLIMNNARFHHSPAVQSFLQRSGVRYHYLPPYSPQLNPIEEVFSKIKNLYKRIRPKSKTREEVKTRVENILVDLKQENFAAFFQHSKEYLQMGYSRIPFI